MSIIELIIHGHVIKLIIAAENLITLWLGSGKWHVFVLALLYLLTV